MSARAAEANSFLSTSPQPAASRDIPFYQRVGMGLVAGQVPFTINARATAAITATGGEWTDVTLVDFSLPDTAEPFEVVSDNAADTNLSGTGAREVIVWGLSADKTQVVSEFEPPYQSEVLTLEGPTARTTSGSYSAILGARVRNRGSVGTNVGTISVRRSSDSVVAIQIEPARSDSRIDQLHVPLGWDARLTHIWVWWSGANPATWELREDDGEGRRRTVWDGQVVASNSGTVISAGYGLPLVEGNSYWFRARREGGSPGETIRINAAGYKYIMAGGSAPDTLPGG